MHITPASSVHPVQIPLSGTWTFALDPHDNGIADPWFLRGDLIRNGATMELDTLPEDVKPTVQVVADWFEPKRLALVLAQPFERSVKR